MPHYSVSITNISDDLLAFLGYQLVAENDEFKEYVDKYRESHLVKKSKPFLRVEDLNDALCLRSSDILVLDDE